MLDGGFLGGETRFGFGTMIIGATGEVVAVRVSIPFDGELLWALATVVGEAHVGTPS